MADGRALTGRGAADSLVVVVAVQDARETVEECLGAICGQLLPGERVVVVDASEDGSADLVRREFPDVLVHGRTAGTLVPQLWRDGIAATQEAIVVLTTAHCVPEEGWLAALRAGFGDEGVVAVGGPIEPGPSLGVVGWAIYFQRYSAFMPPLTEGVVGDVAGDNAAYRRAALEATATLMATGFWEPVIHREFRRSGWRLVLDPGAVVRYRQSHEVLGFCAQRYRHARYFAALRAGGQPMARRLVRAVAAPLVPPLLLWRIAARVRGNGRYGRELARALPFLLPFLACWAAGEASGYLAGARGVARATAE